MRAINAQFELFDAAHIPAGSGAGEWGRVQSCLVGGNPEAREKIQKQWERSQGVLENKGHHFLAGCKLRAFCAQIDTNQTLKGARNRAFCENEVRAPESQRHNETVTSSRLGGRMVFIGTVISGLCGAGVSPAVAGASRTRVRARCSGQDARATAGKMPAPQRAGRPHHITG